MKPTLTHIWLLVEDMPRAKSFYQEMLGLQVVSDLGVFVELNANEHMLLALFTRAAMHESEPNLAIGPVSGQHAALALEVPDLDAYCEQLRAKGAAFASPETNHPEWGLRTAFLADPDNNLLCVYSGIPEAAAS